jgi:hypothetical protein
VPHFVDNIEFPREGRDGGQITVTTDAAGGTSSALSSLKVDYVVLATSLKQPFDLYYDSTATNAAELRSVLQQSPGEGLIQFRQDAERQTRNSSRRRGFLDFPKSPVRRVFGVGTPFSSPFCRVPGKQLVVERADDSPEDSLHNIFFVGPAGGIFTADTSGRGIDYLAPIRDLDVDTADVIEKVKENAVAIFALGPITAATARLVDKRLGATAPPFGNGPAADGEAARRQEDGRGEEEQMVIRLMPIVRGNTAAEGGAESKQVQQQAPLSTALAKIGMTMEFRRQGFEATALAAAIEEDQVLAALAAKMVTGSAAQNDSFVLEVRIPVRGADVITEGMSMTATVSRLRASVLGGAQTNIDCNCLGKFVTRSFDVSVFSKSQPGVWRHVLLFRLGEAVRRALREPARGASESLGREELQRLIREAVTAGDFEEVALLSARLQAL